VYSHRYWETGGRETILTLKKNSVTTSAFHIVTKARYSLNRDHPAHMKSVTFVSVWETHQTRNISIKRVYCMFLLNAGNCFPALLSTYSRKLKCERP